ncbi:hypothetical protein [Mesorhizobium sp.]|uniref:hypothetical protein n=1 Tax=Mesorhizobium sp. TaxID=1871066 RepID=UPI000FE9CFA9|nr:hypothetical protein [Mesorhizobium sp.]RWP07136.1 MAG: hypothetical protein EOQ97_19470 [Mesorhizobium sp.]
MANLKSARHHWWPEGVSAFWKNVDGIAHRMLPDGTVKGMPPKNLGVIGNGHQIRLGRPGEATPWDQDFENVFQDADDNLPAVIQWLQTLERDETSTSRPLDTRFRPLEVSDGNLAMLTEGIISLAVRSPMNRERAVGAAERHRGPLPEAERNALIGLNMRDTHRDAVRQIGVRGKYVAIYSPEKELIFGDGFYHNIRSPLNSLHSPTILAPLTPAVAALFVRPTSYTTLPRFFTLTVNGDETRKLNDAIQVYARKQIFYKSEKPEIIAAFSQEKHLVYSGVTNPLEDLIQHIPGVHPRRRLFLGV